MTKSVCFVPSNNGYGHLRRCASIAKAFSKNGFKTALLWNYRIPIRKDLEVENIFGEVRLMQTPLSSEGPSVRSEDAGMLREIETYLKGFDAVIVDTLTWPLGIDEEFLFIGQFLWEFYYQKRFDKRTFRLQESSAFDFSQIRNRMFGMKGFAWPEMTSFKNFTEIDMLDYWQLRQAKFLRSNTLGFSNSGTGFVSTQDIPFKDVLQEINGLENMISRNGLLPAGVLCRAGLGIISECLSSRTVPVFFEPDDYEIGFNIYQLENYFRVGVRVKDLLGLDTIEVIERVKEMSRYFVWPTIKTSESFVEEDLLCIL